MWEVQAASHTTQHSFFMKKILFGLLFTSLFTTIVQAQSPRQYTDNTNAWFMYFGSHKFASKWGVHLEAQLRRSSGVEIPQQLLLRTGLNYHFNPQAFATVGYCFVETYPYGEFAVKSTFPEHRLWEQIQLKNLIGRFEMVNRFRLEQRFVDNPVQHGDIYEPGLAVYSNRFRSMTRFSVPLCGKTIGDRSWYLTAYDEMFIAFGKNVGYNVFDQNRGYFALGYQVPHLGRVELGYLNQTLFKSDGKRVENNHTLMVGLSSNLPLRKLG